MCKKKGMKTIEKKWKKLTIFCKWNEIMCNLLRMNGILLENYFFVENLS